MSMLEPILFQSELSDHISTLNSRNLNECFPQVKYLPEIPFPTKFFGLFHWEIDGHFQNVFLFLSGKGQCSFMHEKQLQIVHSFSFQMRISSFVQNSFFQFCIFDEKGCAYVYSTADQLKDPIIHDFGISSKIFALDQENFLAVCRNNTLVEFGKTAKTRQHPMIQYDKVNFFKNQLYFIGKQLTIVDYETLESRIVEKFVVDIVSFEPLIVLDSTSHLFMISGTTEQILNSFYTFAPEKCCFCCNQLCCSAENIVIFASKRINVKKKIIKVFALSSFVVGFSQDGTTYLFRPSSSSSNEVEFTTLFNCLGAAPQSVVQVDELSFLVFGEDGRNVLWSNVPFYPMSKFIISSNN